MPISLNRPTLTSRYQPARPKEHDPAVCPACGGLECLCRPRFFPGQLLTDEDLNRLDYYIQAKNKLRNRYLHGWGVVCGLEVLCHPCQGYVTVTAGYALSPCGEDIVVCKEDVVNICELIQDCRERDRRAYDCEPLRPHTAGDCEDLEEEWILAICYDERAGRGLMALRGGASSGGCTRCNCGGSSGCSCGCHEKTNGHHSNGLRKAARPPQCEPTVTCETYRFALRRPPAPQKITRRSQVGQGELVQRVLCCLQELYEIQPLPPTSQEREEWRRWCCEVKRVFQDLIVRHGVHDCQLDERLAGFPCPNPASFQSDADYLQAVTQAVAGLATVLAEYLRTCLCSALLPPCPLPMEDNCVPLASIRVRRRDCHILRVCNIDFRRIALTIPALQYWLSILPVGERIRQLLARLCCQPFRTEQVPVARFQRATLDRSAAFTRSAAGTGPAAFTSDTPSQELTYLAAQAWAGRVRTVNPYTLLLDALGAVDANDQPLLATLERRNPLEAVLLNQLMIPLIGDFLPKTGRDTPPQAVPAAEVQAAGEVGPDLAQLRELVEKQRQMIETLQEEVNKLKRKRGKG